ncbi:3-hydroxyacyl-CoA dehydrogenase [Mariniluteicoccus flavus]
MTTPSTPTSTPINVAVIGLGTMGAGIAEVFAKAGHTVRGIEYNDSALERGRGIIEKSTQRALSKGKLSEADRDALLGRLQLSTSREDVADCQLIIEAVNENLDLKTSIFTDLDRIAAPGAILATNTSSLSITAIAAVVADPGRVVGVHFFNPAPVQTLVEVIRTIHTREQVVSELTGLLAGLGKSPVVCGDRAGFIVNALLVPYLGSAIKLYADGFASREELDAAMVEKAGYPMGPLTLLDLVGHDVTLAVLERMYDETKDRLNAPAPLLTQMVTAGMLGRKSGRGFYEYGPDGVTEWAGPARTPRRSRADELPDRLVAEYLNQAIRMVETGYASVDDVDTGMAEGCRMPKPFEVLAELGPKHVLEVQRRTFDETAEPGHRPARLLEELAAADDGAAAVAELRAATRA